MRSSILILSALMSLSAQAVEVVSAKLDSAKENIIVTVRHGGGCGDHSYELVLQGCGETSPVQCQATIKHMTSDFCEAYLTREAKFNLKANGLKDKYYANGSLTIKGSDKSKATVTLPGAASSSRTSSKVQARCTTHTGSDLVISTSIVTLTTKAGQEQQYVIVGGDFRSIETYPSIDQTTYKLDDGRSIVTEFRSDKKVGTGQFIRVDGTYSPEFECKR